MLLYLDAAAVFATLAPDEAADAIAAALRAGLDPADDRPRQVIDVDHGQLLLMPSTSTSATGVKLVTLAPGNADLGLPTIQGTYVLFDHDTLTPVALLDAAALTAVRTPAVSVAAIRDVLDRRPGERLRILVYGAGPQGVGHVNALRATLGDRIGTVTYVVRSPAKAGARVGDDRVIAAADVTVDELRSADVIVCATTAREPLFAAEAVGAGCVVVAIGSHEPTRREIDGALLGSAQVVVEDVATALRECGDVIVAIEEGHLSSEDLITIREVVTGAAVLDPGRTVVFKGSGMSWQDLVVAEAVVAATPRGSFASIDAAPGIDPSTRLADTAPEFVLDVDGEVFEVRRHGSGTSYDWVSGPNDQYGFSGSGSLDRPLEEHREHVRAFLAGIDPATGFLADD